MSFDNSDFDNIKDFQLERFYKCQDFLLGKISALEIGNGYASIGDEFKALLGILKKYYCIEYLGAEGYNLTPRKRCAYNYGEDR